MTLPYNYTNKEKEQYIPKICFYFLSHTSANISKRLNN